MKCEQLLPVASGSAALAELRSRKLHADRSALGPASSKASLWLRTSPGHGARGEEIKSKKTKAHFGMSYGEGTVGA